MSGLKGSTREGLKGSTREGSADRSAALLMPSVLLLPLITGDARLLPLMTGEARGLRQGERLRGVLERLLVGLRMPFCSIASAAAEPTVGLNW